MQLEIDGIGQQKATLSQWKKENNIFTHHAPHMVEDGDFKWSCWNETDDPGEFLGNYGDSAFGFGHSEKEAILSFIEGRNIALPFWW